MRLLLVPDPSSPNGEDAFCREVAKRAPARGHSASVRVVAPGPAAATAELLAAGYSNAVAAQAGFGEWQRRGLPCDGVLDGEEEDFPDSTF